MQDSELMEKVQSSIDHQCQTRGYAAPVDVLMDVGVLDKRKYEDWRTGKILYLESVCTCSLHQLSLIMKLIRSYAQKAGYRLSYCYMSRFSKRIEDAGRAIVRSTILNARLSDYGRWGMKKKKNRSRKNVHPLWFSKSGEPKIERAYATHYLDVQRIADMKAEAERKRAELMELDSAADANQVN